jgi:Zn-dependent M28 family amino/carboxypeptidase
VQSAVAPASLPGVGWSDHWAFWEQGYPAVMLTDTAPYRYPQYHTAEDTPDKLRYREFARVVGGLIDVARVLAVRGAAL